MLILWDSLFSAYHGHLTSLKSLSTYKLGGGVSHQRPDAHVSIVSVMREAGWPAGQLGVEPNSELSVYDIYDVIVTSSHKDIWREGRGGGV